MKPGARICEVCGSLAGETCWRCVWDTCFGALVFVAATLGALCF